MSRLRRRAMSLLLYSLGPIGSALAPLLVIPAITSRWGSQGWTSIAVGMSVGLAGAVVAELGWAIVGPQRVARDRANARACAEEAAASRLVAVAALAPICALVTGVLVTDHRAAASILAVAILAGALSPSWFFTGLGRPGTILWTETLPRTACGLAAAGVIAAGGPPEVYGSALLVSVVLTQVLASRAGTPLWPSGPAFRHVFASMRGQGVITAGRAVTALYKALPTTMLAAAAPGAVALFSATDRPMRMGLQVLTALPQRLQVWVGVADRTLARRRAQTSIGLNAALGVAAGTVFAVGIVVVAPVLFSGTIVVPWSTALLSGVLVAVICTSRGFGLALITYERGAQTAVAAVIAASVSVPGVVLGGVFAGADGAILGLVLGEVAAIVTQWVVLVRSDSAVVSAGVRPDAADH